MEAVSQLGDKYAGKDADYFGQVRSELLEFIPADARVVLDVGCAGGNFGKNLKAARECEVWGIEPTGDAAATARNCLDNVFTGLFLDVLPQVGDKKFDVICFNDVLEHMPNPEDALNGLKPYLSERGQVIASIPNILHFPVIKELVVEQDFRYRDYGVLDNTHLRFFTKKSMLRMFESCGYDVDRIVGINPVASRKFSILNFVLMNRLKDWRFAQFVVIARPRV
jgi:2-polyprenyl-3-methyl-5-hydroxy-6-metoxy-1,4-benzoquinol methylase